MKFGCEHPPIFTLGTAADKNHIINPKNIPVVQSDRGGEVTYHGWTISHLFSLRY